MHNYRSAEASSLIVTIMMVVTSIHLCTSTVLLTYVNKITNLLIS